MHSPWASRYRLHLSVLSQRVGLALLWAGGIVPAVAQPSPLPRSHTIFENVILSTNFSPDPTTVHGISGGEQAASLLAGRTETATGPCTGFVDGPPDHIIQLTQFFNYLSLQVESTEDTTLVVRGPGGTWCNDDYVGKNPGLVGQWQAGTYQVWVGSFREQQFSPYVIRFSQVPAATSPTPPPPPPASPVTPTPVNP